MVSSILTNNGAMTALQSLKSTQKSLLETQNRISTGLKVGSAKDNAATWAVATSMRSDIANFKQVSENLSTSSGVLSTAASGTQQVADLISKIRVQVTSAQDGVKDAKTIQANIDQLIAQVEGIVGSSSFKGVNLLDGSRSGSTQVLASVNSTGGALTPTYIDIAAQKLTSDEDGMLADIAKVSVSDRVVKFQYNKPTAGVEVNDQVEFTFKKGGVETKATFTATTASAGDLMRGLAAAINDKAGVGNTIARIDASGNLVVDAGAATDGITFNGTTALKMVVEGSTPATMGTVTDLNPPKAKYAYEQVLNDTLRNTGGETFEFSFKVDGQAKVASYTTQPNETFETMMAKLKDKINLAAGNGNFIASIDSSSGKLVVDASKANAKVEFDGEHALKKAATDSVPTASSNVAPDSVNRYLATTLTADTDFDDAADELQFTFVVDGQVTTATAVRGAAVTNAIDNIVSAINTAAGGPGHEIAYKDTAGDLVINTNRSSKNISFVAASALKTVDLAGTTPTGAATDMAAADNITAASVQTFAVPDNGTRLTELEYHFSVGTPAANKISKVTVGGGGTNDPAVGASNKEVLAQLAKQINVDAGYKLATIDENGALVVDSNRGNTTAFATTISGTNSLLVSKTTDYGDKTALASASSGSYSDLLASLQKVESAVLAAGAAFGAAQSRVDMQKDFMDKLVDTLTSGVGALVDADMSEEAARLQALQVQEQLGTQALSIANQAPQSILSLFRG